MKCGFIVLNYKSAELTRKLCEKILLFKNVDLIIVIDNMSPDNSFEELKGIESKKIKVYQSGVNGGYSFGNNYGAKICKENGCDCLFIANPDISIDEKNFDCIYNALRDTEYDMLSGIEYDINNNISKPIIWKLSTFRDDLLYCSSVFRIIKKMVDKEKKIKNNEEIIPCDLLRGSFFCIKTSTFFDVKGFDENVFLFCEERILAYKLKKNNYKIGIVSNAKYNHNHSATINKEYKATFNKIKLLYKSRIYYNITYLHINKIKLLLLTCAMELSLFEFYIRDKVLLYFEFLKRKCEKNG